MKENALAKRFLFPACILISMFIVRCGNETGSKTTTEAAPKGAAKTDTPAVTLSPDIPMDVQIPDSSGMPSVVFFDDYSWKIFIALTWPAKNGERGVADKAKKITDKGPRVFQTYKTVNETFLPDGSEPSDWNVFDNRNPAGVKPNFGELILGSYNKRDFLAQAGFNSEFSGPVVTSNHEYTMVLTAYNESEYREIRDKKWYLKANLFKGLQFQVGAIDIKTAWMDMDGLSEEKKARYYTDSALVLNVNPRRGEEKYSKRLVGLVGMHIVHKTPTRPQWIWSTYEHVDNLPGEDGAQAPYNYYKDGKRPIQRENPLKLDPLPSLDTAFYDVNRKKKISDFTLAANTRYQRALRKEGSVWQYYKLVMTQWPTPPKSELDGTPKNTIPGAKNDDQGRPKSDSTSFANITMETYQQSAITQGCMNCHNGGNGGGIRDTVDFLWTMYTHSFRKPKTPVPAGLKKNGIISQPPLKTEPLKELDKLQRNQ